MTDFDIRRRVAICRYLDLLLNGHNGHKYDKMTASAFVARVVYGKEPLTSYKARCIRQWADEFCRTQSLQEYRQCCHTKCKSIITDENFAC
jgi:hypothetical protein